MRHDTLADVFSIIKNTEEIGRKQAIVPSSNLVKNVLQIMQEHKYIGKFSPTKENKISVELVGAINDCNVVKPRFSVDKSQFIKWEKRFLPAHSKGILILSTTHGVTDHQKANKQGVGGQLLGFVY
ncbi:MAG: 30S ribosomal protein S8 [Candidatus Aenigmarchaeota archaeon]|nr:30S ribosomal protein S8 [Candidatus Aenigmarchaeota archaeon]